MTFADPGDISIKNVEMVFDKLSGINGSGSALQKQKLIAQMLRDMTPAEGKYFIGLITGQMPEKLGAGDGITEQAIALLTGTDNNLVRRVHAITGDIAQTLETAKCGDVALGSVGITLFQPFMPMLAENPKGGIDSVIQKGVPMDWSKKYDGARLLIHKKGYEVKLFSRKMKDVTEQYPEITEAAFRAFPNYDVVVDGECVAVNAEGRVIPFDNVRTNEAKEGKIKRIMKLFDIVYVEEHGHCGESLFNEPFAERKAILHSVVKPDAVMQIAESIVSDDIEEIKRYKELARDEGNEGLIGKALDGIYDFDRRDWTKAKGLLDTIDTTPYAAEYGKGKRKGNFGTIHVGCRRPDGSVMPLGKVATGFSDETLAQITELLRPHVLREEGTMVFFEHNPVVIECACEELQNSKSGEGLAMRFPRVKGVRTDKEADTEERVMAIYDSQTRHK